MRMREAQRPAVFRWTSDAFGRWRSAVQASSASAELMFFEWKTLAIYRSEPGLIKLKATWRQHAIDRRFLLGPVERSEDERSREALARWTTLDEGHIRWRFESAVGMSPAQGQGLYGWEDDGERRSCSKIIEHDADVTLVLWISNESCHPLTVSMTDVDTGLLAGNECLALGLRHSRR